MFSFAQFGNDLYSGKRSFDFIGRRWVWYAVAVALMVMSFAALGLRGINPGIEFRGGSEFRVSKVSDTSDLIGQRAVQEVVADAQPRISSFGGDGVRVELSKLSPEKTTAVQKALAEAYDVPVANVSSDFVGASWGRDVSGKAAKGLVVFLVLVSLVIALYFRTWKMAFAGVVALLHDLLLTVGVYALVGFEVTPASVIGFLTILGYSLYDTVVVFDKVRENTEHITGTSKRTFAEAANLAVNQTLVRSINTSVVALLPVASILFIGAFILGAGTLKDIALALFVGIAAGTYSSVFIAPPLYVQLREAEPEILAQTERVQRRRTQDSVRPQDSARPKRVPATVGAAVDEGGTAPRPSGTAARPKPAGAGQQRRKQQPRKGGSKSKRGGGKRR